jgi:hypothetical protein
MRAGSAARQPPRVACLPHPRLAPACLQGSQAGLKAAAAALLLSADAGMGPAGAILSLAKEALDAIMALQ